MIIFNSMKYTYFLYKNVKIHLNDVKSIPQYFLNENDTIPKHMGNVDITETS